MKSELKSESNESQGLKTEKAEQENSVKENTQQTTDVIDQNEKNSITVTNNESAESNFTVQPVQPVISNASTNVPIVSSKSIQANVMDQVQANLIELDLKNAVPDALGNKQIELLLSNTSATSGGDLQATIDLISKVPQYGCHVHVKCLGSVDFPSTIFTCTSKFGERRAQFTTMFAMFENPKYMEKKRKSMTSNEENAFNVLCKFSPSKKRIFKELILNGKKITAVMAKNLGIIDQVEGLVDMYANERSAAATGKKQKKVLTTA